MDEQKQAHDEDSGPIGIFPSWAALYWAVIIYTVVMLIVLSVFTVVFNHSVR